MPLTAASAPAVDAGTVLARRLRRHGLTDTTRHATPADAAAAMCGVHAQVLSAAEWSVVMRVAGAVRDDVRAALWTDRTLVKTFGPRGTVHLLPARDLPMWTGALGGAPSTAGRFGAGVRMGADQTEAVIAAIDDALADADLTVDELTDAIAERAGAWAAEEVMPAFQGMWPRWRQATTAAAHRGVLCFGADRGRTTTYTHPRRWLPGFTPAPAAEAAAALVHDYLHSYGPATAAHVGRWLGVPATWAARTIAALGDRVRPVALAGETAWLPADAAAAGDGDAPPRGVRLLPYFDAYGVGSHPRALVFPGRAAERALNRGQAGNFPVLLVDGVVAGVVAPAPLRSAPGRHRGGAGRGRPRAARRGGGAGGPARPLPRRHPAAGVRAGGRGRPRLTGGRAGPLTRTGRRSAGRGRRG
ncbi:DNA glycosylase AlkZ-like family protein [Nocardiopsis trehalosi]|uniref:DNA glycosylase AlkZ-like family protein n=1 Tax=Nocardiopsis trehalosi TaxID=109329 RepID=UPI000AE22002|nr:crosslink repair DNA glycosylase YcaQ family protein [Nocardiopsis trehalosi]